MPAMYQFIALYWILSAQLHVDARRVANVFPPSTFRLMAMNLDTRVSSARHARQMVHKNVWATISTISVQFRGVPYGHTVSYSDGIGYSKENSTGKLFFYITQLDSTGADLSVNSTASVALTMAQEGKHACVMDVEDPTCWKLTLIGHIVPVSGTQRVDAEKALFSKHPQMKHWPSTHGFLPYVLDIDNIVLLDFYGGAKHVPVDEYYEIQL